MSTNPPEHDPNESPTQSVSSSSWNEPTGSRSTPYGPGGGAGPQGGYAGPQGGYGAPQGGYAGSGYTAPQPAFGGGPQYDPSQKSFFAKLFDLSFTSYITPSIVKIVYILTIAAVVFGWLMFAVAGFNVDTTVGLLFLLIVGPIYAFFILVLMRITLEFYVAVIRIAEDVSDLRSRR